ncbi:ATP-binding protein [Carnobacterium sp. 1290_CSPC]|uniref:ATP-binding protein n=1 Tax=Carnobacterium sp. 1290_CSPC TaxID=1579347 RepID=UPI0006611DFA|nr:AAA family ATPase [Carnobacterium sp. 1290_CSPC]
MHIQRFEIFGYGKWVDQSFQLTPNLNIFSGLNGSGKTTLMSFLLSVMFGFPNTRRKNARNYDTNDNIKYGGRLYLTNTKYGDVMIERTKTNGKQQLTYTINEGEKQVTNDVSFLWNDLSKTDYLAYFGFSEDDLMDFVWDDEEDFAKSLMSIGMSGRQVLTDITPHMAKQAEEIYKPNGKNPVLNQKIQEIETAEGRLTKAQDKEAAYFDLRQSYEQESSRLNRLQTSLKDATSGEIQLELANQQSTSMNEYLQLHDELESFEFVDFEPELANKWLQHENQSQHITQQLAELTDENDELAADDQTAAGNSSGMDWILNHPNVSEQMVVEARAFRDRMRQNEEFSQELIERRYEKQRLMSLLGAEEMAELPDELSADERSYWQQRYKELENKRIFYNHSQSDMTNLSEKASSLENEYTQLSYERDELEANGRQDDRWIRLFGSVLAGMGIVLLVAYFVTSMTFLFGAGVTATIAGIIILIIGMMVQNAKLKQFEDKLEAYDLDLEDIQSELNEVHRNKEIQEEQLAQLTDESTDIVTELDKLLAEKGGSSNISSQVWLEDTYVEEIFNLDHKIQQLEMTLGISNFGKAHEQQWAEYANSLEVGEISEDAYFQQFEDDYLALRRQQADQDYASYEEQSRANRRQQLQAELSAIKADQERILDQYNYRSGDELLAAIDHQKQMKQKQNRHDILANHLDLNLATYLQQDRPVDQQLTDLRQKIADMESEIADLTRSTADKRSQIQEIASEGMAPDLLQAYQAQVDEAYQMSVEWAANKLAIATFEKATVGESSDVKERVLTNASRFLVDLSDSRFTNLAFSEEGMTVRLADDSEVSVNQLSRGEKALLFVAMRFAFMDAQLGNIELPIIIDEAFSHLDRKYRSNIYRFLQKFAASHQIIFFTVDDTLLDLVEAPAQHVL